MESISQWAENIKQSTPTALLVGFGVIGFLAVAGKVRSYIRLLFSIFVIRGKNLRSFGKKGSWVLITGASDGIGKEYALQIASQGFNLLLVSRTQSKLDTLATEIETKYRHYSTKCQTLAMDFSLNREEDYQKLEELVQQLDIAVLVNNVGLSHNFPVPFAITPLQEMKDIINVNCMATMRVTQLVLPGMIRRKKGLILTMGTFGGLLPTPLLATYSGSKACLQFWSTALAGELAGSGIEVEFIVSYLVTTAMSKIRKPTMMIPNTRNFVRSVLSKIGRRGGSTQMAYSSTPYWSHAIAQWWIENTVGIGSRVALNLNKGFHESIRARALKKQAREAKKA